MENQSVIITVSFINKQLGKGCWKKTIRQNWERLNIYLVKNHYKQFVQAVNSCHCFYLLVLQTNIPKSAHTLPWLPPHPHLAKQQVFASHRMALIRKQKDGWAPNHSEGLKRLWSGSDRNTERLSNNTKPGWDKTDSRAAQQATSSSWRPSTTLRNREFCTPSLDFSYKLSFNYRILTIESTLILLSSPQSFTISNAMTFLEGLLQNSVAYMAGKIHTVFCLNSSLYMFARLPISFFDLIRSFPLLAFCPWCI